MPSCRIQETTLEPPYPLPDELFDMNLERVANKQFYGLCGAWADRNADDQQWYQDGLAMTHELLDQEKRNDHSTSDQTNERS